MNTSFEAVPKHMRAPTASLVAEVLRTSLTILADGGHVTTPRLRVYGVRGATAKLIAIRDDLIATGKLPPEAGSRKYEQRLAPNGKASLPPPEPAKVEVGRRKPGSLTRTWVRMYGVKRLRRQYRKEYVS